MPTNNADEILEMVEMGNIETDFPLRYFLIFYFYYCFFLFSRSLLLLQFREFLEFLLAEKAEPLGSMEPEQELELSTMDDFPENFQVRRKPRMTQQEKEWNKRMEKKKEKENNGRKKKEVEGGLDIGIPGVRFYKLPHKNGAKFNVGNPLSKVSRIRSRRSRSKSRRRGRRSRRSRARSHH